VAHDPPYLLIAVGGAAGLAGLVLFLWLAWRALRRMVNSPRVPLGAATYVILTALCGGLLTVGGAAYGISRLLRDHARLDGRVRLAELRCEKTAPGRVRITFAPWGTSAPSPDRSEQIESNGSDCRVSADLVRLRALPSRLGVSALVRVSRVGESTVPAQNPEWLQPGHAVPAWPLALVVRDSQTSSVAALPDARAVYHLVASPDGLVLEKSGG
jgi:hypothetical protein